MISLGQLDDLLLAHYMIRPIGIFIQLKRRCSVNEHKPDKK